MAFKSSSQMICAESATIPMEGDKMLIPLHWYIPLILTDIYFFNSNQIF